MTNETKLTFATFRAANVKRCLRWHPAGINSWSPSDWLTAITGELGELASLIKMRNRERDGLPGNKFSPTNKQLADEMADVLFYLDLLAASEGVDLAQAVIDKFNEVSDRLGFPDRMGPTAPRYTCPFNCGWAGTDDHAAWVAHHCGDRVSHLPVRRERLLQLSRALGNPTLVYADEGDTVEDALVAMAAEKLTSTPRVG